MRGDISGNILNHLSRSKAIMKCSVFREKMYLREDELRQDEVEELARHREECAECASEYRKVQETRKIIAHIRDARPQIAHPLSMTNSVISRIEAEGSRHKERGFGRAYEELILWLSRPPVRFAVASLLFFICLSFAVEGTSAYLDISRLETTMKTYSSIQPSISLFGQGNGPGVVSDALRLAAGKRSFFEVSGDWVMLDRSSIENILTVYNELQANARILPPEFRASHPNLMKLLTKKKTPGQLDAILKQREALIRELDDLIPQERETP